MKADGMLSAGGILLLFLLGNTHTVGLKTDGTVVAAGDNSRGQCNVSGWRDIVAVAAGFYHTVGLKADGTVVAVGSNDKGQCNVSGWRDIGPGNKEQLKKELEAKKAIEREKEAAERKAHEEKVADEKAKEKAQKKRSLFGLILQFSIMIVFFYLFFGTGLIPKSGGVALIFGVISLAFGVISLLYRKDAFRNDDKFLGLPLLLFLIVGILPKGIYMIILMDIVVTFTLATLYDYGFFMGIGIFIGLAISAIPGVLIISNAEGL